MARSDNWYLNVPTLVRDALSVSSGTLAGLTGLRDYASLEAIQNEFVEFCEENAGRYTTWLEAWQDYRKAVGHA